MTCSGRVHASCTRSVPLGSTTAVIVQDSLRGPTRRVVSSSPGRAHRGSGVTFTHTWRGVDGVGTPSG